MKIHRHTNAVVVAGLIMSQFDTILIILSTSSYIRVVWIDGFEIISRMGLVDIGIGVPRCLELVNYSTQQAIAEINRRCTKLSNAQYKPNKV